MDVKLTKSALDFFGACDLAKSMTGSTPEPGTQCWILLLDDAGRPNKKCEKCPYFLEFQPKSALDVLDNPAYTLITLQGEIGEKQLPELKKLIDTSVAKAKPALLLDGSALTELHHAGLGMLLRAYKAVKDRKNEFFLLSPNEYFTGLLRSTMLIKILPLARSAEEVESYLQKKEESVKSGEAQRKEAEKQKRRQEAETLRCWDFFKGHNPKNATACAVCHYKASSPARPCWIVINEIEGVSFEYINEDCLDCPYYLKLNPDADVQEVL